MSYTLNMDVRNETHMLSNQNIKSDFGKSFEDLRLRILLPHDALPSSRDSVTLIEKGF